MASKFWIFLLAIGFYQFVHSQDKKVTFYLDKINTSDQCELKQKYTDSLTNYLYKSELDANTKLQISEQLIQTEKNKSNCQIYPKLVLFKSKLLFREAKFHKAIAETEKLKIYCQEHNVPLYLMRSAALEGRIYNRIDRYDSALINYKLALEAFKRVDTTVNPSLKKTLTYLYANIARVYMNMHQDSLADIYHIKYVNLAYKIHDYERISFFENILGWKYFIINDYRMAEKHFLKALKDSAKIKYKIYNISNHQALGEAYDKLYKPQKALYHDSIALDFFIKTNNNTFKTIIYDNIAKVYLKINEFNKALINNNKAIYIAEKHGIIDKLITARLTQSQILISLNNYDESLHVLQALISGKQIQQIFNKKQKARYYKLLADIYVYKNNYQKAYKYLSLHQQYIDSVNARKLKALSGTETKYQKELLRKRVILGQQELRAQKRQKQKLILSVVLLVILILIGLLYGYKFYSKYKAENKAFEQTLQKIEKLNAALFHQKQNVPPKVNIRNFREFLKDKYNIEKIEVLDVWESISNGVSRAEYAQKNRISENTVKAWRKELYNKLKQQTGETKFSDYKAVIEYYKSLRDFEYFNKK